MTDNPPYLTLVDGNTSQEHEREFVPLPYYPWDCRPPHLPVEPDEAATALHLAHGDAAEAAALLKAPVVHLNRLIRRSPALQRIQQESLEVALAKAASLPIRTLFDPTADRRAQEWASTKLLQSKLAQHHPLSPAPPSTTTAQSLTLNQGSRSITFRWRTDADLPPQDDETA